MISEGRLLAWFVWESVVFICRNGIASGIDAE